MLRAGGPECGDSVFRQDHDWGLRRPSKGVRYGEYDCDQVRHVQHRQHRFQGRPVRDQAFPRNADGNRQGDLEHSQRSFRAQHTDCQTVQE